MQVLQPAQLKLIIALTAAISWHAVTVYVGLWVAQGVVFIAGILHASSFPVLLQ